MKKRKPQLIELISRTKIRTQLYAIYFIAIFLPLLVVGTYLLINTSKLLTNYYQDLLESDNLRVKTILFEITTQLYNISEEISFENKLQEILITEEDAYHETGIELNNYYTTINNNISTHT